MESKEEMFKESDIIKYTALLASGIIGEGNEECVKEALELPQTLKIMLINTIILTRKRMAENAIEGVINSIAKMN